MGEAAGNFSMHHPPDSLVNFNLGVAITFSVLAPLLNGIVILPILWLKWLRTQPYQYLTSNYLSSTLAVILEFGLYRSVQIVRYKIIGFEAAERTECGVAKFFEFPITASNFCLFILGFERFLFLQCNEAINRFILILLIALPWALAIYRQAFELTSSKSQYQNIPYAGLCLDVTSEQQGKEIATRLLDLIIPFIVASVTISLAYAKAYSEWRVVNERLNLKLYSNPDEKKELKLKNRYIIKIVKTINLATAFFSLRILITTLFRLLIRQVEEEESTQQLKDYAGALGIFFLLLETVINPVVFVVFNNDLREALGDKIPFLRSPLVYPSNDSEVEDEAQDEDIDGERPNTYTIVDDAEETDGTNLEDGTNAENATT